MLERLRPGAVLGVPARGAGVQPGSSAAELALRARAQQLREQAVVAEPLAARVEPEHEPVGALERRPACRAPELLAGQRVREVAADAVDDRRAQQERAQLRRLAVEHLGEQVVADHAVVAGELA